MSWGRRDDTASTVVGVGEALLSWDILWTTSSWGLAHDAWSSLSFVDTPAEITYGFTDEAAVKSDVNLMSPGIRGCCCFIVLESG